MIRSKPPRLFRHLIGQPRENLKPKRRGFAALAFGPAMRADLAMREVIRYGRGARALCPRGGEEGARAQISISDPDLR